MTSKKRFGRGWPGMQSCKPFSRLEKFLIVLVVILLVVVIIKYGISLGGTLYGPR